MKRKAVYLYVGFTGLPTAVLECGHSESMTQNGANWRTAYAKFQRGTLYRNCATCDRKASRERQREEEGSKK